MVLFARRVVSDVWFERTIIALIVFSGVLVGLESSVTPVPADAMRTAMETAPWAWVCFILFVVVGTFVMINLFVAVVINSLEETKASEAQGALAAANPEHIRVELRATREALARLEARLAAGEQR